MNQYHESLVNPGELRNEWRSLKSIIKLNYASNHETETNFWILIYGLYKNKYPNICKLIMARLIMPMTTVSCERGFYTLNFIKNEYRNHLYEELLDCAIRIAIEGPEMKEFDFLDKYGYWRRNHTFSLIIVRYLDTLCKIL